jgi:predicted RNA-binding Zn-ribbon protein involved in translation (DUF1610 family)
MLGTSLAFFAAAFASRWFDVQARTGVPGWWFQLRAGVVTVTSVQSYGGGSVPSSGWSLDRLSPPAGPLLVPTKEPFGVTTVFHSYKRLNGFGVSLHSVSIAMPQPALLCLAASAGLWLWARRARRRAAGVGRCPQCGYDTAGLSLGVPCPECGEPIRGGRATGPSVSRGTSA